MTKENELYNEIMAAMGGSPSDASIMILQTILQKFFSQNVVIPKGENRHPYADILHEWVEGAEIEVNDLFNIERFIAHTDTIRTLPNKYRIKPKEQVYEWQWLHYSNTSNEVRGVTLDFFTEDEVDNDVYRWVKIEETKRVRQ